MSLRDFTTIIERRKHVEEQAATSLPTIGKALIDSEEKIHCENLIGAISLPLGVAGPLEVAGSQANGSYYLPLATTEGALVASVSRGSKAITESGGAHVSAYSVGVTRGPVFATGSLNKSQELHSWLKSHEAQLKEMAASTSSHLQLRKMMIKSLPSHVFVRFHYDTQEAMGMNMVTIATQKIVELIEAETGIACLTVAGNFDIDKKPAWLNVIGCRGREAWAEAVITKKVLEQVLKTTATAIFDTWLGKCMLGSYMSGSMGFNCHFANVVAALYAATGQDLAHVVEGSTGITVARANDDGSLYISVYLPAIMVGTVGGGTKLKTQTEARSIMKVHSADELAEVVAGAVLAGELSLLASLSVGSLAGSHQRLGR